MKTRVPMHHWNQPAKDLAICHPKSAANSAAGYIRISRNNKVLYLHRWLWEELIGPIPVGHTIDHKNRIKTDCRIQNLRCVPEVINLRNSSKRTDNTSGITGVSYWNACHAWRAVTVDHITKKQKIKSFSIKKYGNDLAFNLACNARQDMMNALISRGAGYTVNHGQ